MTTVLRLIYDRRRSKPRVFQPFQKQALGQNLWSHWDLFHGFQRCLHEGPNEDPDGLDTGCSWFQGRLYSSEKEWAQWMHMDFLLDFLPWNSVSEIPSPEYGDRKIPNINTTGISPTIEVQIHSLMFTYYKHLYQQNTVTLGHPGSMGTIRLHTFCGIFFKTAQNSDLLKEVKLKWRAKRDDQRVKR